MFKNKTIYRKRKISMILMCSFFVLVCFAMFFTTLSFFSDEKSANKQFSFSGVILDGASTKSYSNSVNFTLVNQQILEEDISFAKTAGSASLFVRVYVSFSTLETGGSVVAKDIIKYQPIKLATPPSGYAWVQWGEYYYLMDSSNTANLKEITDETIFTLLSKDSLVIPPNVVGNYSYDNPVSCSISIEAIQSQFVSPATIFGTKNYFKNTPSQNYSVSVDGNLKGTANYGASLVIANSLPSVNENCEFSYNTKADGTGATIPHQVVGATHVLTNITQDLSIYGVQKQVYYNVVSLKNGQGTVGPIFSKIYSGTNSYVKIIPNYGFGVKSVLDNSVEKISEVVLESQTYFYYLTNVSENHNIYVVFVQLCPICGSLEHNVPTLAVCGTATHYVCDGNNHDESVCGAMGHFNCDGKIHSATSCRQNNHFDCDEKDHSAHPCGKEGHFHCVLDGLLHELRACGVHWACVMDGLTHTVASCGNHYVCDGNDHSSAVCGTSGHYVCSGSHGEALCHSVTGHHVCANGDHTSASCGATGHYNCYLINNKPHKSCICSFCDTKCTSNCQCRDPLYYGHCTNCENCVTHCSCMSFVCNQCNGTGKSYTGNTCSICSGTGHAACAICSGIGTRTCSSCSGSGTLTCSSCSGNKTISYLCSFCNGSGSRSVSCSTCDGTGYVYSTCFKCGGDGIMSNGKRCTLCGGALLKTDCSNCTGGTINSTCSYCSGYGSVTYSCGACNGTGSKTCSTCSGNKSITCGTCSGTGRDPNSCNSCNGSGNEIVNCIYCERRLT